MDPWQVVDPIAIAIIDFFYAAGDFKLWKASNPTGPDLISLEFPIIKSLEAMHALQIAIYDLEHNCPRKHK